MGLRRCTFRQKPDETQSTSDSIPQSTIPTDLSAEAEDEAEAVITILRTDIFPVADEAPDEAPDEITIIIGLLLSMFLEAPVEPWERTDEPRLRDRPADEDDEYSRHQRQPDRLAELKKVSDDRVEELERHTPLAEQLDDLAEAPE